MPCILSVSLQTSVGFLITEHARTQGRVRQVFSVLDVVTVFQDMPEMLLVLVETVLVSSFVQYQYTY